MTTARRSARNPDSECQIDSIAQSWAVLSGAGDPDRSRQAMQSVMDRLVRPQDRLILLFTPPFDKTPHDPGYIKGYLPGTRENGGQYTHAAIWSAWAFASLGDGKQAGALFNLLNPIFQSDTPEKVGGLPGGTLRRVRRYLQRATLRAPRRLDLVHRLGRLDVPAGGRRPCSASIKLGIPCASTRSSRPSGMASRSPTALGPPPT